MASTFEEALDRLIVSCQTYRRQCEDYRNKAISGQLVLYVVGLSVTHCHPRVQGSAGHSSVTAGWPGSSSTEGYFMSVHDAVGEREEGS